MRQQVRFALLVAVLSCLVFPSQPSIGQGIQGVKIIRSTDAEFGSEARTLFPDVAGAQHFDQIKPLAAIILNSNSIPVRAYAVKWTLVGSDGKVTSIGRRFAKGKEDNFLVSGRVAMMRPGEAQLVLPFARWTSLPKARHSAVLGVSANLEPFTNDPLVKAVNNRSQVKVSLDAVLGADGNLAGPDTLDLGGHFQLERNGQHDEGVSVSYMLSTNLGDADILNKMRLHIAQSYAAGLNGDLKIYRQARAEMAQRLIDAYNIGGRAALQSAVSHLVTIHKTRLKKSGSD